MKVRKRDGRPGWQVDYGIVDGRRLRKSFGTKQEAEAEMAGAKDARRSTGDLGLRALSSAELFGLMAVQERLARAGVDLDEAVSFYLQNARKVRDVILFDELVKRFIKEKERLGRSKRTLQTMRVTLPSLSRSLPGVNVSEVTRVQIEAWLAGNGWSPRTQNNRLGEVSTLFRWAMEPRQGYASENPCVGIPRVDDPVEREEVVTLSFERCVSLLELTRRTVFAPYVALGLFCGIRRAEAERLRWSHVHLKEKTVIVAGDKAKTRARRVVDVSANALLWLKAAFAEDPRAESAGKDRKIVPANFKDDWIEWRRDHGFDPWPHNALRHTYASYHYAMHQNEALLQAQMGKEDAASVHRDYRAIKTKAEARKFWKLRPG